MSHPIKRNQQIKSWLWILFAGHLFVSHLGKILTIKFLCVIWSCSVYSKNCFSKSKILTNNKPTRLSWKRTRNSELGLKKIAFFLWKNNFHMKAHGFEDDSYFLHNPAWVTIIFVLIAKSLRFRRSCCEHTKDKNKVQRTSPREEQRLPANISRIWDFRWERRRFCRWFRRR